MGGNSLIPMMCVCGPSHYSTLCILPLTTDGLSDLGRSGWLTQLPLAPSNIVFTELIWADPRQKSTRLFAPHNVNHFNNRSSDSNI